MKKQNDYFKTIEKGTLEDAVEQIWNEDRVEIDERIRIDKRTKSVTLNVKKSESGELQKYLNSVRTKENFDWHVTKNGNIIISPKDTAARATFPKFMTVFMNYSKKIGKFGSVKIVTTNEDTVTESTEREGTKLDEVVTNYKLLAKDIKKEFQQQLRKKKFLTLNDIESYVMSNADSPHKVETDEIVKELKKLRITVAGKFPHKREEVEIDEAITSPSRYIDILNKLREETEYQKFFKSAMKKFGIKSPGELSGDKEKKFYDYVDKNWKGKNEPKEVGEKRNEKTLTGKPKDKIDVNPQTSDKRE